MKTIPSCVLIILLSLKCCINTSGKCVGEVRNGLALYSAVDLVQFHQNIRTRSTHSNAIINSYLITSFAARSLPLKFGT